ncbi:MAG TPA: 1,4-alpha-glucan branching enzyme, partial [Actinomycetota bacterium]|nr:1,4-alpha-glucan branching enzyme [Actinomycetota bacterium]
MKKDEVERLVRGEHHEPHRLLGAHTEDRRVVIRVFRPDAIGVVALVGPDDQPERVKLDQVHDAGLFEGTLDGTGVPAAYRLEVSYPSGAFAIDDPYR